MKISAKKLEMKLNGNVVLLISAQTKGEKATPVVNGLSKALSGFVREIFADKDAAPSTEGSLFRHPKLNGVDNLVIVKLPADAKLEDLRQAAAHATRHFQGLKSTKGKLVLNVIPEELASQDVGAALAEGLVLGAYNFNMFKKERKKATELEAVEILTTSKDLKELNRGIDSGKTLAECVNFSRTLGDRPGNLMTPTILAAETAKAAKGTALKVTVWGREKIRKEQMGCFLGVSLGSEQEPKFIMLEYRGAQKSKKPMCLVGKGLTFDSGGISIKPSSGMEEMKYDMCGGANVIGTMLAIAKLKLNVNAIAFVPATENMPGPNANKPGDICFARNGVSVEVNNTDAEGRLILADALVYASEQKPAFILDAATLTGAMSVALGNIHTGYFARKDVLAGKIEAAAEKSGEAVWQMPLVEHHLKDMKGTYADLNNISSGKGAGSATAAAFLSEFVEKDIPWAHFDIAGTAWHTGGRVPYNPKKGASGVMIRTFVELARMHERDEVID